MSGEIAFLGYLGVLGVVFAGGHKRGQHRCVLCDGKGQRVAFAFPVGDGAVESVGGERPEEWARVRAVGEGIGRDVAGPAEQEREKGAFAPTVSCSRGAVQDERCGHRKRGVEGCVRGAEESSGADLGVELGAGEPPESPGCEPGGPRQDG